MVPCFIYIYIVKTFNGQGLHLKRSVKRPRMRFAVRWNVPFCSLNSSIKNFSGQHFARDVLELENLIRQWKKDLVNWDFIGTTLYLVSFFLVIKWSPLALITSSISPKKTFLCFTIHVYTIGLPEMLRFHLLLAFLNYKTVRINVSTPQSQHSNGSAAHHSYSQRRDYFQKNR